MRLDLSLQLYLQKEQKNSIISLQQKMVNNTTDGNLSVEMIQKLSAPKDCAILLRASMYTYFQTATSIHSIFNPTSKQQPVAKPST
ncbi:hypothetical protein RHMOL_Rhmol04G0003100 [Rhododendron molle]|uniref:Uncharacterized protein n=1 Tax=Rhododendron molle TaxID=49168 RepID=A0ACC0NX55_RHOML|nr:hypothetical protein RHMOL_Rhmol04G0003100 [Rhododendron molle]